MGGTAEKPCDPMPFSFSKRAKLKELPKMVRKGTDSRTQFTVEKSTISLEVYHLRPVFL